MRTGRFILSFASQKNNVNSVCFKYEIENDEYLDSIITDWKNIQGYHEFLQKMGVIDKDNDLAWQLSFDDDEKYYTNENTVNSHYSKSWLFNRNYNPKPIIEGEVK